MRKSIKVTPEQQATLCNMKRGGEDYADVVGRLLNLYTLMCKASPIIGGAAEYWRVKSGTKQEIAEDLGSANRPEMPDV